MKLKELKNFKYEEFEKIINQLKDAFEFENEMLTISKKYVEKQVLFDYISTSSTFLCNSVFILLNKVFNFPEYEDIISWWVIEKKFGTTFHIGDIEDKSLSKKHKYREPDLSTTENFYFYLVYLSEQWSKKLTGNKGE